MALVVEKKGVGIVEEMGGLRLCVLRLVRRRERWSFSLAGGVF